MASNNKIQAIQGLRFLFAIGVVLLHLNPSLGVKNLCPYGYIGVTFFFVLSGYLSVTSNTNDILTYYKKKFWRIYPIHWFALLCILCIRLRNAHYWVSDTIWQVGLHISLLQSFYPDATNVGYGFNSPAWFLSALLLFYILLPFLQRFREKSIISFYVFTILMGVVSVLITIFTMNQPIHISDWGRVLCPFTRLFECLLGMCLYDLSKRVSLKLGTWVEIGTLLFLILTLYTVQYAPKICLQIYWWIPALMIVVYVGANSDGVLCKLLSNRLLLGGVK